MNILCMLGIHKWKTQRSILYPEFCCRCKKDEITKDARIKPGDVLIFEPPKNYIPTKSIDITSIYLDHFKENEK